MPSNRIPMAQFLRELCTRAQRSTVYTAGQRQEFFLINVGPSGMDVLRAAADTIERAPADRSAEVAALEQRATDLSVQLARAFALIAGAASTLEDIARGQPPRHRPDGGMMVATPSPLADMAREAGCRVVLLAHYRAHHLREALALAQSSGLIDPPTSCVHDCGQPCTSSRLCQPPADRHPGAKLEDGEEVLG